MSGSWYAFCLSWSSHAAALVQACSTLLELQRVLSREEGAAFGQPNGCEE